MLTLHLQEADNFRSMVLDYAAADFPPIGSANIADKKKTATDALSLFLNCRWSKMSRFDLVLVHNSLGALYQPGARLLHDQLYIKVSPRSSKFYWWHRPEAHTYITAYC